MGMKRIYSIESNIYRNACETDNINDLLKWLQTSLEEFPLRTIINIRVRETPEELWISQPKFDKFIFSEDFDGPREDIPGSD